MTPWIKASERLPDEGVRVLAWHDPETLIAYRVACEWREAWMHDVVGRPQFWQPLPLPPAEAGEVARG